MKKLISAFCSLTVSSVTIANTIACKTNNNTNTPNNQTILDSEIEESKKELAIEVLKNGIDCSHLSVNNTVGDALDEIQETILANFPEVSEIIFPEGESENYLKPGNNYFTVGLKDSKGIITNVNALITNVQSINFTNDEEKELAHDEARSLQLIKQKFEHGLNASYLYGWNTIYDALEFFQNEAKKINKNAQIIFTEEYLNSTIGQSTFTNFNDDPILTPMKVSNQTIYDSIQFSEKIANFKSFLNNSFKWVGSKVSKVIYKKNPQNINNPNSEVDLGKKYAINKSARSLWESIKTNYIPKAKQFYDDKVWPSIQKGIEFVKSNLPTFKTWLSDKFHEFTHIKSAFLSGKEQQFGLLLTFADPLTEQSFPPNQTIIKGKLWGMQKRSRENAKKIIEKEIFPFHGQKDHQIDYSTAIEAFRQHAEAHFFPIQTNVDPAKSFQLRTVFENPQDMSKKLQKGLNLIPVVLKPDDSWKNWVWNLIGQGSDLKVLIQVRLN